jgi:adenylosuccinate lyase
MLLERTLDDSANRRIYLAELFLATDTIIDSAKTIIENLIINEKQIEKNLDKYGPFAATEALMMMAVKKGASRQTMHELFREHSMYAYTIMQETDHNPLEEKLLADKTLLTYLSKEEIKKLLNPKTHIGLAPLACKKLLCIIHDEK